MTDDNGLNRGSWIASERPLARRIARPLREFLATETAGSTVLLVAAVIALLWANIAAHSYESFWHTRITLRIGSFQLDETLAHWVNDALMVIFFFVVSLEIKRELVKGELADPRKAALPAIAALGGMVVPAIIYAAFNAGGEGAPGWGIPMATDIAFAVGVLALLGRRVPSSLKIFLLTLAIADDMGGIAVIAIFYTEDLNLPALLAAAGLLGLVAFLVRIRVWYMPVYVIVGTGVWLAMFESGIHATIAGVALGLLTPVYALAPEAQLHLHRLWHDIDQGEAVEELEPERYHQARVGLHESVPVVERLEHGLLPWSSFVVIPIFALANAGVVLSGEALANGLRSPITIGVALGLLLGKPIGIFAFTWMATRLGLGRLPSGVSFSHVFGASIVAGIGFTVALFIGELAFDDAALKDQAKVGILAGSLLAAIAGTLFLRMTGREPEEREPEGVPASAAG